MQRSVAILSLILITFLFGASPTLSQSSQWKITSVKVCRSEGGFVGPILEATGSYPVYTFFVPRPVWTVNGTVVDAQPMYDRGKLTSFHLMTAGALLKTGAKNTVKFALPDHNGAKVFFFDTNQIPPGQCYEFF